MTDSAATEVATTPLYTEDDLAAIETFEDAIALLTDAGINVTDITDYGDGFEVMDKAAFVNVPLVILDWKFAKGSYDEDFVVVRLVTADKRKALITDGSSGLREQIRKVQNKGKLGGVICRKGLTVSEYTYVNDQGEHKPASTYYLAM